MRCAVDLKIEPGEFVAIMAPAASASPLMNMLGCLDKPAAAVHAGGTMWRNSQEQLASIRTRSWDCFQGFNLLRGPRLENVSFDAVREMEKQSVWPGERISNWRAGGRLDHFPPSFSGGQQQRVAMRARW